MSKCGTGRVRWTQGTTQDGKIMPEYCTKLLPSSTIAKQGIMYFIQLQRCSTSTCRFSLFWLVAVSRALATGMLAKFNMTGTIMNNCGVPCIYYG